LSAGDASLALGVMLPRLNGHECDDKAGLHHPVVFNGDAAALDCFAS
jgi:hypothetical protein